MDHWTDNLERASACSFALDWARFQPDELTAWERCERSDWMLWVLERCNWPTRERDMRLLAVNYAERVLHLVTEERARSVCAAALETARTYAVGEATDGELAAARTAARAVARGAGGAARAAARVAAGSAAEAAHAIDVSEAAARADELRAQCDLIRRRVSPEVLKSFRP